jgi:hypothetical protein
MAEIYGQYGQFEPRTALLLVFADMLLRAEEKQRVDIELRVAAGRGEAEENGDYLQGRIDERAETIQFLMLVLAHYDTISEFIAAPTTPGSEL